MKPSFARRIDGVRPSAIRELLALCADPSVVSFGGGYPDQSLFPMVELQQVFSELLSGGRNDVLQYATSEGLPRLREQVAARLTTKGTPTKVDDVLIVQGGQQGLDLVAKLMIDAGDVIATENPTFLGGLIAFAPYEPRYLPIGMDDDGMITDELEEHLKAGASVSFIYTVPDFHNPTGVTLSLARRRHLLELANQYDIVILEDSPYRELRYSGEHIPTIKSMDTEGRVIHLGSFSKILAPGLRLGWIVAEGDIRSKLGLLKLAADTQCSTLNMSATAAYLDRYDLDAHIAAMIDVYRGKRDFMLAQLTEHLPGDIRFTRADGGLFTWLTFPEGFDAADFMANHALPKGRVAYVPGASFFPVTHEANHARMSFSGASEERVAQGVARLGELLTLETVA